MHFVDLAEMHAFSFIARDFKNIFHGPLKWTMNITVNRMPRHVKDLPPIVCSETNYILVDALLHFSFYGDHVFRTVTNEEVDNI